MGGKKAEGGSPKAKKEGRKSRSPEGQKSGRPEVRKAEGKERSPEVQKSGSPVITISGDWRDWKAGSPEGRRQRKKSGSPEVRKSSHYNKGYKGYKGNNCSGILLPPPLGEGRGGGSRAGEEARGPGRGSFYFILPRFFTFCSKLSRSLRAPFFVRAR